MSRRTTSQTNSKINRGVKAVSAAILQRSCACGRQTTSGAECTQCEKSSPLLQRHALTTSPQAVSASPAASSVFSRAAVEPARPIHEPLRSSLGHHFGGDFSHVKVHSGPASQEAAGLIGARAYTLGTDIHLGEEARRLSSNRFDRLMAHEAIHTLQQGGHPVTPHSDLTVSSPNDAAEREADRLSESVTSSPAYVPSRSMALRDRMRATMPAQQIARSVSPQIQRDLTGKFPTAGGDFNLNLKTESHAGAKSGMSGTIKFKANDKAPDSTSIRLLQVARDQDLITGKEYVWTGAEASRNKVMTTGAPGVDPGAFVDLNYGGTTHLKKRTPRKNKADSAVSPYYIDDYGTGGGNQDGSKKGKAVVEASLWDYPGSAGNRQFSFETIAKASDTGHVYGTIMWGFTISDASKGTVDHERAVGRNVTLLTSDKAIENFDKFYRNPGASTAPK